MDQNSSALVSPTYNRIPSGPRVFLASIPALFLGLFYVYPLITLAFRVVNIEAIKEVLGDSELQRIAVFTFSQAMISVITTLLIGLMPAYVLARYDFKGRRFISALAIVPFMLPTVVVATAFVALLPDWLHNTMFAVVIVHVFFNISVVIKIVGSAWSQIPRELEDAAKTLGASPLATFSKVTFQLLNSAFISAGTIIFLFTFTSFGVIQIIGGPKNSTLEVEVARQALTLGDISSGAVISFIQLEFLAIVLAVAFFLSKKSSIELNSKTDHMKTPAIWREKLLVRATVTFIVVGIGAPIAMLIASSFRLGNNWSLYAWKQTRATEIRPGLSTGVDPFASVMTSVKFTSVAILISLVIGLIGAIAISISGKSGKYLDLGYALPLATSAVTLGFSFLIAFSFDLIDWRASWWLIPVGHSLIAIPFVIRILLTQLRMQPIGWKQAAATLGAKPLRGLWAIDIARLRKPLQVAAGVTAAISLGEFGATTFLTRTGTETMPIAIAKLVGQTGDIPRAQGFMLASVLALTTTIIVFSLEAKNA